MDFSTIIKHVLGVLPFLLLCFSAWKINLNKTDRSRQFLMPIVALVYCIVAVVLLDNINNWLLNLFNWLGQYISFFRNLSWQSIATYVMNSVFVLAFIALKSALLPVLNGIWKSNKISEVTSGLFYEYEEDVDKWLLKKQYANVRGYIKGFFIVNIIVSAAVFVISRIYPDEKLFQAVFYPAFGIIVLGEVVCFLSGITKSEFVEDILGEDEESYKVANYSMLREILRDLFSERVLYENTCDSSDGISAVFDELEEMTASEDASVRLIGTYYQNLKSSGAEIDINYVKSSINLLNGKSTLFCNPFYNDLTHYILLPMMKQLISYKKCLIVLGRDSALDDVKSWIDTGLENFSNTDSLWQSEILNEYGNVSDVGIIKFSDIHNLKIHKANKDFLSKVGFVLIIEPSRILASGQIGLSLLVNNCEAEDKEIVYCACDRNCDGLVDALSHILKTSITEVTATVNNCGNSSHMYWNADGKYMHHRIFPNISRYLGVGTEINSVAMKYQIDKTGWIGSEKFPVVDMKWIAGQYHKQICRYADLPESQASFDRSFNVYSNLWSSQKRDNSFLVVEDEFQNLFEITRLFASRARSQGFVNVISENYLLRDYMLDNVDVFSADPKAIPTIVPDYARTERNMVLKLMMMMVNDMVSEERVKKEMMICGITFDDPYLKLKELIMKHCNVQDASMSVRFKEELNGDSFNSDVVKYYEINETNELYEYAQSLKNAYYIAEDEEGESHYIGAKLYGHVFQAMLPGQFMTFDGKYYEIQTVTPLNGVVVRRAADHITGRHYYRQIRRVSMNNWVDSAEMGSKRTSSDIEITRGYADVTVDTDGYLDMASYGDLAHAKKVSLNGLPTRNYRNKSVLKVKLPDVSTSRIQYTICLLLNEIFRTTYPETYHYISALTLHDESLNSENLAYATYRLDGDCEENCIYIVEDSDIDLGLIVSVERNLRRYLEIISEILNWHTKKMQETPEEPESDNGEFVPDFGDKPEPKRKGILGIIDKIKGLFKGKKSQKPKEPATETPKEEAEIQEENPEEITETDVEEPGYETAELEEISDESMTEEESVVPEKSDEIADETAEENVSEEIQGNGEAEEPDMQQASQENQAENEDKESAEEDTEKKLFDIAEGSSLPEEENSVTENVDEESPETEDIGGEDEEVIDELTPLEATEYQKKCFIKFGYASIDEILDIDGTRELLHEFGFDKNPLQQVRESAGGCDSSEGEYNPHKYGAHLCDFCGVELLGGEYELLKDGRERCNRCSMTAVKKVDDFKALYKNVLRNMEAFYGIKLNVAVKVRTTNAKQIAKHVGSQFVATPGFDGRVLGFAQKDKTGYSLYIENGSPKLAATATIAHELTHIWQYLNWNEAELAQKYGKQNMLEVYEGMAKWAEIQYLMLMNEKSYALRQEITTRMRDDEYGRGFIIYAEKYPLSDDSKVSKTPFKENPPL
ncbi:MAG: hypothetical protein IJF20_01050 [Clostridia bacterium]|nr:hypothetical protein [Clostridia bacterium]